MTLTKEDFKDIADGDWLHVEFENGDQVSGVASSSETFIWIRPLGSPGALAMADEARGPVKIIEHRPTKRAPNVGDVIKHDEWNRYDWPTEGSTWLTSATGAFLRSVGGDFPQIYNGAYANGSHRFTVVQLPTPASDPAPRVLTTVEELEALPVGSIIEDADESALRRCKRGWGAAGRFWTSWTSSGIPLPVTVLREGGAES